MSDVITSLVRLYRAFPFRPHCHSAAGIHTVLCRLAAPLLLEGDGPRCGDFDEL